MPKRDYYEVLEVSRDATGAEIKTAYRRLAKKYHPDLNLGSAEAEEHFKEAAEAYDVLSDGEKRRLYDQFGHEGLRGRGVGGFSDINDIFSSFGDVFDSFFGFGRHTGGGRTGPLRGTDLQMGLRIGFREAVFGCEKEVEVRREVACGKCSGSGVRPGASVSTCTTCGGAGQVQHVQGFFSVRTACPRCRGTGRFVAEPCETCRGTGRKAEGRKLSVKIPPGVDDGMQVRLSGEGEGGHRSGPHGDLYVVLHVEGDSHFKRDGENVFSEAEIGIAPATLGTTLSVETLDGSAEVEIPRGTQSGDVLTLEGKGVPRVNRPGRGNHYVAVRVLTPTRLSKRQEELLREFADEAGESVTPPRQGLIERIKRRKR